MHRIQVCVGKGKWFKRCKTNDEGTRKKDGGRRKRVEIERVMQGKTEQGKGEHIVTKKKAEGQKEGRHQEREGIRNGKNVREEEEEEAGTDN